MAAASPGATRALPLEAALTALESALSVVFPSAAGVAAACLAVRHAGLDASDAGALSRLAALVRTRHGPAAQPVVTLLCELAEGTAHPWSALEALLGSTVADTCARGLETARRRVEAGTLAVDVGMAGALARLAARDDSPLLQPEAMAQVARLLRAVRPRDGAGDDPLSALLVEGEPASLRHLAARVLDLSGALPTASLAARLLGEDDARRLARVLAYTRAGHLDLARLVPGPGARAPVAACLAAAEPCCGPALLADIVGELGWPRVNLGLTASRVAGVSVDGSLPFLLRPALAGVAASCRGAGREFDRVLIVAQGGAWDTREAASSANDAIDRFRAYNLAHAGVLADILDVAPLDAPRVHTILRKMDPITAEFAALFASRSEECAALPGLYDGLKRRILAELETAAPGRPLSVELTRLVQMFEDPPSLAGVRTLHGLKRYLHQRGLALGFGLLEASGGTNRTVDLLVASAERALTTVRRIEYVDFDPDEPGPSDAPALPYAVAIVADAFARHALLGGATALPRVRVFCYGNEVHYFVSFRNHPVFIRIDYSPPLGGGMIDLAYYGVSKFEIDSHPAIGLEALQAVFRRLDFFVEVDTTRVHARYDKERALDLGDLCEKAEALFRLVPYLMDLDWIVGSLDLPSGARHAVAEGWADLFARWGVLPTDRLLTADRLGIVTAREARPEGPREIRWDGVAPYRDTVSGRPGADWVELLHDALGSRGIRLPGLARQRCAGQVPLERHLLRPLEAALARGELVEAHGDLRPASADTFEREHEAHRFAAILAAGPVAIGPAARLARLAAALERTLQFETTGSVNGYDVQRAALVLRGESGAIVVLRDERGFARLALHAPDGAIGRRRAGPDAPWSDLASCDVGALARLLRRNNFLPAWIDAADEDAPDATQVAATFRTPPPGARHRHAAGAPALPCLRASPGRAVGLARLGLVHRRPEDLDGGVLFAATLSPEDQAALHHAVAVVGTGGGILSHAGLMAVQCGRPALVMRGTWREDPGGRPSIAYQRVEFDERHREVQAFHVVERSNVREREDAIHEGDLVVADADEGELIDLGQDAAALALHDDLRDLEAAARGLATATTPEDVLAQRGRRLRAAHQLERLFGRLDDPALVEHAVRTLLASVVGRGGHHRDETWLLRLLSERPATAGVARDCLRRDASDLSARATSAFASAMRLLPDATLPGEVLALRTRALALLDAARDVRGVLADAGATPPACEADVRALDDLAADRLRAVHAAIARTVADESGHLPGRMPRRHAVRVARDIETVVTVSPAGQERVRRAARDLESGDRARLDELSGRRVVWPADGGLEIEPLAGAKAANLAELGRLGVASLVPPWFAVTDRAFREALGAPAPLRPGSPWAATGDAVTLAGAIDAVAARADTSPEQQSALIRQLWLDVRLPDQLVDEVGAAYRRLGDGGDPFVAIRSSAREEDTAGAVRAGEFDTFLFVRGTPAVLEHLRRAWSGLWTARAIHDRRASGRAGLGEGGGVIVQRIVLSRVSGVMQTVNVAEGRPRELVIDAGLGLGEGVVSGLVAADHIVVSKDEDPETMPLRFRYVTADKRARVIFDERRGTGTVRADVLSHQRLRPALEYVELVELACAARRLEAAYGHALDIEFGFDEAGLRLLQVRPVPGSRAAWHDALERHPLRAREPSAAGRADATSTRRHHGEA